MKINKKHKRFLKRYNTLPRNNIIRKRMIMRVALVKDVVQIMQLWNTYFSQSQIIWKMHPINWNDLDNIIDFLKVNYLTPKENRFDRVK